MGTDEQTVAHAAGACQPDVGSSTLQVIAWIVPNEALLTHYILIAAMLHRPDLAARHVNRLHPADFAKPLHQHIAQMAIAHVRLLGRADLQQIRRLITESDEFAAATLTLELRTVWRVADLLDQAIVDKAAHALIADRTGRRGRGAA